VDALISTNAWKLVKLADTALNVLILKELISVCVRRAILEMPIMVDAPRIKSDVSMMGTVVPMKSVFSLESASVPCHSTRICMMETSARVSISQKHVSLYILRKFQATAVELYFD